MWALSKSIVSEICYIIQGVSMTAKLIRRHLGRIAYGKPFSVGAFLRYGSTAAVYQTFSRLVKRGVIARVAKGVYVRPKTNPYVGKVLPSVESVLRVKAKGETLEVHGAKALNLLGLSTQVPMRPVFYTTGRSRLVQVNRLKVKLVHTSPRKLKWAGTKIGLILCALWYLGRRQVTPAIIQTVLQYLSPRERSSLLQAHLTHWMRRALTPYVYG